MKKDPLLYLLMLLLMGVAGIALVVSRSAPASPSHQHPSPRSAAREQPAPVASAFDILWRQTVSANANPPTPLRCGWFLTEKNGTLRSFTGKGDLRWQLSYSNRAWQASAVVDEELLCAIAQNGDLVLFEAETGRVKWSVSTEMSCSHPPLVVSSAQGLCILLLSQENGMLLCLRAEDGKEVWRSPMTNRTDSPMLCFRDRILYGNCDAAVHVFSATNGLLLGSIQLNDDEQIAGAIQPLGESTCVVGTRSGTLLLLDVQKLLCLARVKVSDSETFFTPIRQSNGRIVMPLPEGKLAFWRVENQTLQPDGELLLGSGIDEAVALGEVLWVISNRSLHVVQLKEGVRYEKKNIGDDIRGLSPGCFGKCVLLVDGEMICMKGLPND